MIKVEKLCKTFGDIQAVKNVSFEVETGSLFSLLGTNGAGKSTTINILTTLLEASSGEVTICGFKIRENPDDVRKLIGIVFQESLMDKMLTVKENLLIRGGFYGMSKVELHAKVEDVLVKTQSKEFANQYYQTLSGGQKRRADIARALLHTPKILFLDEPTTGLDPKTRQDIWLLIKSLQKENGMTIFLTTHYMEEAATSDNIIIMHRGEIRAQGIPEELKMKYSRDMLKLTYHDGTREAFELDKTVEAIEIINTKKEQLVHVEILAGTLDDVFLNIKGGKTL